MVTNFADDLERRVGSLLDRVPGYRGYRSKEDRRDADRRLREHVATLYGQQADRIERVARELADQRRLTEIGPVEDFTRPLRHLIDRIRTASYGYGGLLGDRDVDGVALDQLRLFDEGLLAGVEELEAPVTALEAAAAASSDLAPPARTGANLVRAIHGRFDLRGEVVATGQPAPEESVLRVLRPADAAAIAGGTAAGTAPHPAYELALGDALAVLGDDALVDARIAVSGAKGDDFRLFRLGAGGSGGIGEEWLLVPGRPGEDLARLKSVAPPPVGGEATLGGASYTIQAAGVGEGEITGASGGVAPRSLRYQRLVISGEGGAGPDAASHALVLDWSGERQAFAGRAVHPDDIELFGRPSTLVN